MELSKISENDFDALYALIEAAFPIEERPTREGERVRLSERDFSAYAICSDGECVGYVTLWSLDGFYYVEHFAIREEYRNRGFGALALDIIKDRFLKVVLEAEPHDGGIASRRLGFYERGGFVINDFPYIQPSYHGEDGGVPLMLLSYPDRLAAPIDIAKEIYKKVYKRKLT